MGQPHQKTDGQVVDRVREQHIHNGNIKRQAQEWAPKMILTLWDHMLRLWQYRNGTLHKDDSKRVAQFKVEALDRDIERLAMRRNDLRSKRHDFQERHMKRWEHMTYKHYNTIAGNVGHLW
jgi:hypothetical protein